MKIKSLKLPKFIFYFLGLLIFVLIWEICHFAIGDKFIPEFFTCLWTSLTLLTKGSTYAAIGNTLLNLLISIVISLILGITLGTLSGYYQKLAMTLTPIMTSLRAIPTIALIFLLMIYVPHFNIYVVVIILLPIIYQSTYSGANKIYSQYQKQLSIDGKKGFETLIKVIFPLNFTNMLLGFIQAFGLGLKIQIMAETFSYQLGDLGLGDYIQLYYNNVDYSMMMSYVLLCILLSLLIDAINYLLKLKLNKFLIY